MNLTILNYERPNPSLVRPSDFTGHGRTPPVIRLDGRGCDPCSHEWSEDRRHFRSEDSQPSPFPSVTLGDLADKLWKLHRGSG